jgi:hypothetical protein
VPFGLQPRAGTARLHLAQYRFQSANAPVVALLTGVIQLTTNFGVLPSAVFRRQGRDGGKHRPCPDNGMFHS